MTTGKHGMGTVIPLKGRVGKNLRERKKFCGENITIWAYGHHTFSGKRRLYDRKNNKAPLGEKQAIEAHCRFGGEISDYLSTAPKGLGHMGKQ